MSILINYRPRVLTNQCVRVIRKIKGTGTLSVSKNQEVSPHDIIGDALLNPGFIIINLSKELKTSAREAIKAIQKAIGVPIYKGELLAQKKNLFGSSHFLAPTDCMIEQINQQSGEITLKMLPKKVPLLSGVFGIIDGINTLTGEVYIKTIATQILGLFGSGRPRSGFLKVLGNKSNLTDVNQLNSAMKGEIVVTGGFIFGAALKKAMEYQVDGLISGGLNMDDYVSITSSLYEDHKSHSDIGMSLVATEGFGPLSLGNDIYDVLKGSEGKFTFINGFTSLIIIPDSTPDAIIKARKIALPAISAQPFAGHKLQAIELKINQPVRIVWPPFAGVQGVVTAIDGKPTLLSSGISSLCAVVEIPNRKLKVPISNLEAI